MLLFTASTRIPAAYAVAGSAWILFGNVAASRMFGSNILAYSSFETAKGFFFVGATAAALHWLLRRRARNDSRLKQAKIVDKKQSQIFLEQAVEALLSAMNARDPYTANHQRRVAALSTAIARRMGLAEDRIRGIRTGALLHDIGKIAIPVELLAKTGKLSTSEFNLIREHVRSGLDIVNTLTFEPAVHAVVVQHHERLDGSGYPNGLFGTDIMLEARIVAVADVVEAITSHRPYRPGLGAQAAAAEIRSARGTKLDAQAVDACLAIIDIGLDSVWN